MSLIFNDTKVFLLPAFMATRKDRCQDRSVFAAWAQSRHEILGRAMHPARKNPYRQQTLFWWGRFAGGGSDGNTTSRGRTLRFLFDGTYEEFGIPCTNWVRPPAERDFPSSGWTMDANYQCIYAKNEGAVVAPTAGMHFSRELMRRLEISDCKFSYITMHAGLGNFRKIDVEDLTKYKMDSEQMFINNANAEIIKWCPPKRKNICAVGTTVMRAIEQCQYRGLCETGGGWATSSSSSLPEFSVANSMISNFHLPLSTHWCWWLLSVGYEYVMNAYKVALKEDYKFGTYGDAMLII